MRMEYKACEGQLKQLCWFSLKNSWLQWHLEAVFPYLQEAKDKIELG